MTIGEMQNYEVYPAVFDLLTVNHINSIDLSSNVQKLVAKAGGSVDVGRIAEVIRENEVQITSGDIGTILSNVSVTTGLKVETNARIQYQQREDGGVYKTTAEHVTINGTKGILIPRTISSSQDSQQGATIVLSFIPLRVGSNAPLIVNVNQSLSSVPAINTLYKQGPILFEGTLLKDIQDSQTDFGITFDQWRGSGDVAAERGSISDRQRKLEFTGRNLELSSLITLGAIPISSGITQYYRQIGFGDNEAQHIAITFTAGTYEVTSITGQTGSNADLKVMASGALSISVSTASTIPTS
ncbi:hypothetical protein [Gimesia aquarii]|uniref:Uncharacterized protein n=1 Tax=Gimesia aquarii TaxID=2527964 RepID=A0A517VRB7_9PLAN|nr:hypothetical protein [Gimesia aquarii]QDT95552.1 hypothetical protein V144x_09970 [Gimesia aquarii]